MTKSKIAVLAVGGNAIVTDNSKSSIKDQMAAVEVTCRYIADMVEAGWNVVVTHGNGPQVGFILRRSELTRNEVPELPLEYAGANTQGVLGHMFEKALFNEFKARGIQKKAIALVTQVLVDANDSAFKNPTKPIGSYMEEAVAKDLAQKQNWAIVEDSGRGYRRVVASPKPLKIVELDAIKSLSEQGYLVIACGGGGIPVIENAKGDLESVPAVIDKDLASALLADQLKADLLVVPTGVERVAVNFGKPNQKWLDQVNLDELKQYSAEGQFPAGSMGPKISAICDFIAVNPESKAIITNLENLGKAVQGKAGTLISAK